MRVDEYKGKVLSYFRKKANKYDLVDQQSYWQLSDELLWYALRQVLDTLPRNFVFLDAGGGTGRWALRILDYYSQSRGIIYDLSQEMLKVARRKSKLHKVEGRLEIIQGDLAELKIPDNVEVDLSFNFHNVLGFVSSPKMVIGNMVNVTKRKGFIVSLVPNLYHNIFFNIKLGRLDDARRALRTSRGGFTEEMPEIYLFTPEDISSLYKGEKLEVVWLTGFPVTIYPGIEETKIEGSTEFLQNLLSSKKNYDMILAMEKSLLRRRDIAARGNNILIVGKKIDSF